MTFVVILAVAAAACIGPRSAGELRQHLWAGPGANYDKFSRPQVAMNRTALEMVEVTLRVRSLLNVQTSHGQFLLDTKLQMWWKDERLRYLSTRDGGCLPDSVSFGGDVVHEIWQPSTIFDNEVGKVAPTDGGLQEFTLSPNGEVQLNTISQRTFQCRFDFKDMPFDTQRCIIRMGMLAFGLEDTVLKFRDPKKPVAFQEQGFGTVEFAVSASSARTYNMTSRKWNPKIDYLIEMKRDPDYLIFTTILPCLLLVAMSYSTFFLQRSALPARVASGFICFLTIANMQRAVLDSLPLTFGQDGRGIRLLYFMMLSMMFCAFTIFQTAAANYLMHIELRVDKAQAAEAAARAIARAKRKSDSEEDVTMRTEEVQVTVQGTSEVSLQHMIRGVAGRCGRCLIDRQGSLRVRDQHVDIVARWAFPVAYVVVTIIVWSS